MIGGVDKNRWLAFRAEDGQGFKDFVTRGRDRLQYFEKPFVSWRNDVALFMGPRLSGYSAVDVEDPSEVEIRSRQLSAGHVEICRDGAPVRGPSRAISIPDLSSASCWGRGPIFHRQSRHWLGRTGRKLLWGIIPASLYELDLIPQPSSPDPRALHAPGRRSIDARDNHGHDGRVG